MMKKRFFALIALVFVLTAFGACGVAHAYAAPEGNAGNGADLAKNARSAYLMDYDTGTVLYEKNSDAHLPIASMVKIMTLVIAFEEMEKGTVSPDTVVTVSERAAGMGGSQMFLDANTDYCFGDLVKGVVVCSANDAAVAIGETLSGSLEAFIDRMNATAARLGMQNTVFVNVTGLPQDGQYSCARDVSTMMRTLLKNQDYYQYSRIYLEDFKHPSGRITGLTNTNKLIRFYQGCDGGKTGFTNQAMFCLSATAKRGDMRLIATVIGEPDSKTRFAEVSGLFNYGFANYEVKTLLKAGEPLSEVLSITGGEKETVRLAADGDLCAFGKKGEHKELEIRLTPNENVKAPIKQGDIVGSIALYDTEGKELAKANLIALDDIEEMNFWKSLKKVLRLFW